VSLDRRARPRRPPSPADRASGRCRCRCRCGCGSGAALQYAGRAAIAARRWPASCAWPGGPPARWPHLPWC